MPRFGPERRIRRRPEFQRVYDAGQRLGLRLMTVIVVPNGLPQSRLGVSATRKLGGSVTRNRAKRVVREIFRQAEVPGGLDIVVIPRPTLLDAEYQAIEAEFRYALRRATKRAEGAAASNPSGTVGQHGRSKRRGNGT